MPARHWPGGFRVMFVSIISSGAGSVAVSARPALANTLATSGNVLRILSCAWIASFIVWMEAPGRAIGMWRVDAPPKGAMKTEARPRETGKRANNANLADNNRGERH